MSSLTTTTINTKDGVTNLTVQTGNSAAARIVVGSGTEGVVLGGNSSANVLFVNSTSVRSNVQISSNTLAVNVISTNTVSGNVTFQNTITFSANVTVPTISSSNVNISGASIATSGHSRLPNGLLMQWGSQTNISTTTGLITFPTAFASAPFSISAMPTHNGSTSWVAVTATSTTTATVRTAGAAAQTVYWWALGV